MVSENFSALFGMYLPRHYFESVVLPNWETFYTSENHLSAQHATNLALTAYHLHEWVFYHNHVHWPEKVFGATTLTEYRKKLLSNGLKDIGLIHDIATMSKHLKVSRRKGDYKLSAAGQINWEDGDWSELAPKFEDGEFVIELYDSAGLVLRRSFEWMMYDYIEWWSKKFNELGLWG